MTVQKYIVSEDGRILKYLHKTEPTRGNPYREATGRFGTRKKIKKATKIYFVDQKEEGKVMTKEEYDKELAKMLLGKNEKEEVEKDNDDDIV